MKEGVKHDLKKHEYVRQAIARAGKILIRPTWSQVPHEYSTSHLWTLKKGFIMKSFKYT